jgi:hypothetical protein
MNAMIMSALTALGIAGFFGVAQSEPKKAMDECCAKRADDCCAKKPDNCCETKIAGCCEKMKDECCTWSTTYDGKRTHRLNHCVQAEKAPGTVRIEVKPEDRKPGDIEGSKTMGKRTERVWYRDVERIADTSGETSCSSSKDDCNYTFVTVGKHTERRSFCEHHNQRVMCGDKAGECGTCRK